MVGAAAFTLKPALSQVNIGETICVRVWTKTLRPDWREHRAHGAGRIGY